MVTGDIRVAKEILSPLVSTSFDAPNPKDGSANQRVTIPKLVTGIQDNTATAVLTVTVPNQGQAAVLDLQFLASMGAGGAIGAFEASNGGRLSVTLARTAGLATVANAGTATETSNANVAGAGTLTVTWAISAISGSATGTQTFTVNVTIAKSGGGSSNHQLLLMAAIVNALDGGCTIS